MDGEDFSKDDFVWEFYEKWIEVYKRGSVRDVTLRKYEMTCGWIKRLIPEMRIKDMNRINYQKLINAYSECHEKQTTMDFHHQLKGALLDAVDEGLLPRDPTRKAIIKGKAPRKKKPKYLNKYDLHKLVESLDLTYTNGITWEWLIDLIAKTGLRLSEALAVTPADFDFAHQTLSVNKTWDYKNGGGFSPTKNKSSIRKVELDWRTVAQFSELTSGMESDKPIFIQADFYKGWTGHL